MTKKKIVPAIVLLTLPLAAFLASCDADMTSSPSEASSAATADPVTDESSNGATEDLAHGVTEPPAEVPAETLTDVSAEAITETPTEATAEVPTEAPTEAPAEVPTEAPTEATAEVPTETPTEPETEEETAVNVIYEAVQNPIHNGGGDPWVVEREGEYFYCYSAGNGVCVARVPSLHQLSQTGNRVYTAPAGTAYSKEYWAPELHYLNGEWYIYVAADDGNNENHRMYVLKGTSRDPTDPFEFVGQITDPSDKWAIDGTVMELNGELYFIWSGWEGNVNVAQNIYIAHMSDPCTIDSQRVCLSVPTCHWEKVGEPHVNEGPAVLQHGGKTFVVYSASGSWTDNYCLGMLTLTGDDPLNPEHWDKAASPVFRKRTKVAYGPGHCSFSKAPDGSVWMIYHANPVSGTGWSGRSVWISPVTFDENGIPDFGKPEQEVQFPVGIE